DFLNLLASAAAEEPTFSLRMRSEVTELVRDGGRVRGVRYRTEDGDTHTLLADVTVACDGRWSLARAQAGVRPRETPVPIDVWWFRLSRKPGTGPQELTPTMRAGQFFVVIPRRDYFQIALVAKKGLDPQLRRRGIAALREDIAAALPELADRVDELTTMDQIKHLDVRLNRLHRWHTDGLLCIGDAAHAMSPIGGVGINLAVQDAVAAARTLAEPLRQGRVSPETLALVRRRRLMPTLVIQGLQRALHHLVVAPVVEGRRSGPPKPMLTLLRRAPWLSFVPAYLLGVGSARSGRPRSRGGHPRPEVGRRPQAAWTGFVSVPMPSMVTETCCPASMGPTPSGVPVRITSPGSSVITDDTKATRSATLCTISEVRASCFTTPSTSVVNVRSAGSTSVEIHGPSGKNESKPL